MPRARLALSQPKSRGGWHGPRRVLEAGEHFFERAFIEGAVLGSDKPAGALAPRSDEVVFVSLDQPDGLERLADPANAEIEAGMRGIAVFDPGLWEGIAIVLLAFLQLSVMGKFVKVLGDERQHPAVAELEQKARAFVVILLDLDHAQDIGGQHFGDAACEIALGWGGAIGQGLEGLVGVDPDGAAGIGSDSNSGEQD